MKNDARSLIAVAFFLGLSGAVKGATKDDIIMTLPFEFVAGGKILPAGTYTVRHVSDESAGPLILAKNVGMSSWRSGNWQFDLLTASVARSMARQEIADSTRSELARA